MSQRLFSSLEEAVGEISGEGFSFIVGSKKVTLKSGEIIDARVGVMTGNKAVIVPTSPCQPTKYVPFSDITELK